jgi:hydroxypyruvate isomerase
MSDEPAARYSAHIGYLFGDLGFKQRFHAAKQWGFSAVENPSPYATPASDVARWLTELNLSYVQFGLPAGDPAKGEKGLAALPDRVAEFRESVAVGLDYAQEINCSMVHAMAGICAPGQSRDALWPTYLENIAFAADAAARRGITILIEPMSPGAVPDYFIDRPSLAIQAIHAIGRDNVRLLFDVFHTANLGLDPISLLREYGPMIAHVHLADFPGRHEPGTGALDFAAVRRTLAEVGYQGFLGCEYVPQAGTTTGLGWLAKAQGAMA